MSETEPHHAGPSGNLVAAPVGHGRTDHLRDQGKQCLICPECQKQIFHRRSLLRHIQALHQSNAHQLLVLARTLPLSPSTAVPSASLKRKRCSYPGCSSSFSKTRDYERHMMVHRNETAYKCLEQGCERRFRAYSEIKAHSKKVHQGSEVPSKEKCYHPEISAGRSIPASQSSQHTLPAPSQQALPAVGTHLTNQNILWAPSQEALSTIGTHPTYQDNQWAPFPEALPPVETHPTYYQDQGMPEWAGFDFQPARVQQYEYPDPEMFN